MSREQDIIHLYKLIDANDTESMQVVLSKNFAEIENGMSLLQKYIKTITGGSVADLVNNGQAWNQSVAHATAALIAAAAAQEAADGKIQGFFQNDEPTTNMGFGDIWIDTDGAAPLDESCIYRYEDKDGGSKGDLAWHACPTSAVGMVYLEAYVAKLTADDALVNNSLYIQYSSDGEDWHNIFDSDNDMYMRQKVGDKGTWSEAMRIKGVDGHTPIKGTDYFDGVDGVDGEDGTSAYLWVRYSDEADGNPMTTSPIDAKYIGVATTTTPAAPTGYGSYLWSLVKGTDGIPGEAGADGQTSYLHIKYSDDGETFTAEVLPPLIQSVWETSYYVMGDPVGQGFRPTNEMAGATKVQVAVLGTEPYIFLPDYYIDFYIYDDDGGKPGGSLSSTGFARVAGSEWPSTPGWVGGEVALDAPLEAGEQYWLVLVATGNSNSYVKICVSGENPYPDGCITLGNFPQLDTDMAFKIEALPSVLGESPGVYIGTYTDFSPTDSLNFADYTWNKVKGEDGHDVEIFTSQPKPPYAVGDLWVESDSDTRICVVAKDVGGLFDDADWQETAATKITTFYQAEIPVAKAKGDLWVDTDDNNKMYRAASQGADAITPGEWEPIRDLGVTRSAATYIIADEATSNNAKNADYIVPAGSTSAQEIINEAINALPSDGGKVLLLDGTYIVDAPIILYSNVIIEGQGQGTKIKAKDNAALEYIIINSDLDNGNSNITIASLSVDGGYNRGNTSIECVHLKRVTESNIVGCRIENGRFGILGEFLDRNTFSNNLITRNFLNGVILGGCRDNSIIGNFINYSLEGMSLVRSYPDIVIPTGNIVMGNNLSNNARGMYIWANENTISGNTLINNSNIGLYLGGDMNTVTNNVCKANGYAGLSFYGYHNVVSGNVCSENSQDAHNVYSNIELSNYGSYNNIQNNNCRRGELANKPKYGIGILSTSCRETMVTNNDLYTGGATASFFDGGTSTKTTATNRT